MSAEERKKIIEAQREKVKHGQKPTAAPKTTAASATSSAGTAAETDADLLTNLLRDHLYLRQDVRSHGDALQLAVLFKNNDHAAHMKAMADCWVEAIPEGKESEPKKPRTSEESEKGKEKEKKHPLGPKKQFMIMSFLAALQKLVPDLPASQQTDVTDAIEYFQALDDNTLGNVFASFRPKYPKPLADRTWLWILTPVVFLSDDARNHLLTLAEKTSSLKISVERKRSGQSVQEGKMWQTLKSRPKTKAK